MLLTVCDGHFAYGKQKLRSMVVNSGVKGFGQVVSAIKQVATKVHIVNYEQQMEQHKNNIAGILKYFDFMFLGDGKVQLYDQNLKFDELPEKVINLDENYRIILDSYVY